MKIRIQKNRGVALLMTLGLIALLAILTTLLMESLRVRLIEKVRMDERATLLSVARAGLAAKLAEMAEFRAIDGALYGENQGWAGVPADAQKLAGETGVLLDIRLSDESGRFPINLPEPVLLSRIFKSLSIPDGESDVLAAKLADWIDADNFTRPNGAEAAEYAMQGKPANRPMRRLEELREVAGFKKWFFDENGSANARFKKLSQMVSLDSLNPRPNLNGATEEALAALCAEVGCNSRGVIQWRNGRERSFGGVFRNETDLIKAGLPQALGENVTFTASMLRLRIRASKGEVDAVLEVLVDGSGRVFRIEEDSEATER